MLLLRLFGADHAFFITVGSVPLQMHWAGARERRLTMRNIISHAVATNLILSAVGGTAMVVPISRAIAQSSDEQTANECISNGDEGLENSCSFTINAGWCVESIDCSRGRFSNNVNISAGSSFPYNGRRSGNPVHFGACRGKDTLIAAPGYEFRCREK